MASPQLESTRRDDEYARSDLPSSRTQGDRARLEAGRALGQRESATLRAADFVVAISAEDRGAMVAEKLMEPPSEAGGNGNVAVWRYAALPALQRWRERPAFGESRRRVAPSPFLEPITATSQE